MKLGFLTGDYRDLLKSKKLGFTVIELDSGAFGNAKTGPLDKKNIGDTKKLMKQTDVTITALAFYDVAWSPPSDFSAAFARLFEVAEALGVDVVATMSGFDSNCNWDENLTLWEERFRPVAAAAEKRGMKIAFENWMSVHGRLPHKPCNFGGCPGLWREWFRRVPSPALGLEFDPSHLYWQGIDHIRALKEFGKRVYHVHAKDTEMFARGPVRVGDQRRQFPVSHPRLRRVN